MSLFTLLYAAYLACLLVAFAVLALKRRWGWLVAGLAFLGVFALYGAWQPARPGSWWDRRFSNAGGR